eukprot:g25418.t1
MRERLGQLISLDELTKALKSFEKNKTPGSDGLPAELYSALWELIGQDLLEVYENMLRAGTTCESMRKGIFTLIYKQKREREEIRKDVSQRGVTILGSGGLQVKASLYVDDVAVFCTDQRSVNKLLSICDQFELASDAKVNRGKNKAMFFGNWADRSCIPFTVRTDYLKVLVV